MHNRSLLEIKIPESKTISSEEISDITRLINRVYLASEHDFWPQNGEYNRTTVVEIANFIKKKELIIAKLSGEIVGAVHVYRLEKDRCGFGMLVACPNHRGMGIGSSLMEFIENWAKKHMYKTIQLELLRPVDYVHPEKEFLKNWYTKLNYTLVGSSTYEDLYPIQAHLLKIPCTFDIYQKNLKK